MMTQPAVAAAAARQPAAGLNGTAADGARTGGAEANGTAAATTAAAAPFSLTLQALAAGLEGESALQPGALAADAADAKSPANEAIPSATGAAATAARQPAAGAESKNSGLAKPAATALPKDLMRALFAKGAARPAQTGAQPGSAMATDDSDRAGTAKSDGVASDTNALQISTSASVPVPVPTQEQAQALGSGAALLAAVLQWLQPSRSDSNDPGSSASAARGGHTSGADPMGATGAITATATATANASANPAPTQGLFSGPSTPASATGARQDLAAAAAGKSAMPSATLPAAQPLASWAGPLAFQRETRAQATLDDVSRQPRDLADADLSAGNLSMAAALRATSAANAAPAEHSVAVPVHDRHWPTAMAAQVLILSSDKVRAATLRLSPEHLGPVEVHIDMQDSNVNVNFTATHAETRAALEQAMPQLRTVLAGAGLTLGQATVQQQARRESQNPGGLPRAGGSAEEPIEAPVAVVTRALGMIDEYV